MKKKKNIKALIAIAIVIGLLCLIPVFVKSNYYITMFVMLFAFAALGTAWNIISGYARQSCWCLASFMSMGAYSGFILYNRYAISPWISIFLGIAISVVLALGIGAICFRQRGMGFTLMTTAVAEIVRVILVYCNGLTNGTSGLYITYKKNSLWNLTLKTNRPFFYIMLAILVISIYISYRVENGKLGYYLRAIGADQDAAESLGINAYSTKMKSLLISAVMASAIGTIYTFFLAYIDPNTVASLALSTKIGTMAIVGGIGKLWGPLIGASILIPLNELTNKLLGSSGTGVLLYGVVMILVVLFRPRGVWSFFFDENDQPRIKLKKLSLKKGKEGNN